MRTMHFDKFKAATELDPTKQMYVAQQSGGARNTLGRKPSMQFQQAVLNMQKKRKQIISAVREEPDISVREVASGPTSCRSLNSETNQDDVDGIS